MLNETFSVIFKQRGVIWNLIQNGPFFAKKVISSNTVFELRQKNILFFKYLNFSAKNLICFVIQISDFWRENHDFSAFQIFEF